MRRKPKDSDYFIELPNVGVFRFGRRTFKDRADIRADYLRLTKEFGDDDAELSAFAAVISSYKIMCVEAPAGWQDIESIELTDEKDGQIFDLFEMVRKKDDFFRKGTAEGSEEQR